MHYENTYNWVFNFAQQVYHCSKFKPFVKIYTDNGKKLMTNQLSNFLSSNIF